MKAWTEIWEGHFGRDWRQDVGVKTPDPIPTFECSDPDFESIDKERIVDILDKDDRCGAGELCGGCTSCLMMQASGYYDIVELDNSFVILKPETP